MDLHSTTAAATSTWDLSITMGLPSGHHLPLDPFHSDQRGPEEQQHEQREDEEEEEEGDQEEQLGEMKEMMYKIAAMQPVNIDPSTIKKPSRRNVRISDDPQSVAARHRRERISERIRILQRLVPGGTKMDTASMLEEAVRYVKYLKKEVHRLQSLAADGGAPPSYEDGKARHSGGPFCMPPWAGGAGPSCSNLGAFGDPHGSSRWTVASFGEESERNHEKMSCMGPRVQRR